MLFLWLFILCFSVCSSNPTSDPRLHDIEGDISPLLERSILDLMTEKMAAMEDSLRTKFTKFEESINNKIKDATQKCSEAQIDIARFEGAMSVTQWSGVHTVVSDLETRTHNALYNLSKLELDMEKWKDTFVNLQQYEQKKEKYSPLTSINYPYEDHTTSHVLEDVIIPQNNSSSVHQLLKLLVQPSCNAWRQNGFSTSGYYRIDPDGPGIGQDGFTVFCDMTKGFTFVHHDAETATQADQCSGSGCFNRTINYSANEKQITALMKISQSCQQFIEIKCLHTPLQRDSESVSWWVDRYGSKHDYWSGDSDGVHTCNCGITGSCVQPTQVCNCNADMGDVLVTDQGYLTNTSILPVTEVCFGDTLGNNKELHFKLGPLQCYGKKHTETPDSCGELWSTGRQRSGYYFLGRMDNVRLEFCNMEKLIDEGWSTELNSTQATATLNLSSLDARVDHVSSQISTIKDILSEFKSDVLSKTVIFNAERTTGKDDERSYIVFDKITVNIGDGYNSNTGLFTAPVSGVYLFSANTLKQMRTATRINIRKNENIITWAYSHSDQEIETMSCTAVTELVEGDEVGVQLTHGEILGYSAVNDGATLFLGILLNT